MSVLNSILNLLRFNRKNWKVVTLCVFAATIFWLFNSLNKNYTTNINFPLTFVYDEINYIAVKPLPSSVRINVTGIGWDLFRRSIGLNVPSLVIPLEKPADIKKIVAIPGLFAHQMERFQINFLLSDTLHVSIEPKTERWINLRLDASSIHLKNGYVRTSDPTLIPDSIFIEGPASLINSFIEPVYLKLAEQRLDSDYKEEVQVELLNNEFIKRRPNTVEVKFTVDKTIEVKDSVQLTVINYPKGAHPFLGINALHCTFAIPERFMKQYRPDSLRAIVDLTYFKGGTQKLLPEVHGLPPYAEVLSIDSIFVKF